MWWLIRHSQDSGLIDSMIEQYWSGDEAEQVRLEIDAIADVMNNKGRTIIERIATHPGAEG